MYFHESKGRVKILPARVQYAVLHGNACNKRFILYSCTTLIIAGYYMHITLHNNIITFTNSDDSSQ